MEMDVLLLLDVAAGRVAGVNAIAADASQTEAADWVAETLARPLRGHARPRGLRVEGADLAAAVRAKVGPRVAVRVAPVPEADEAMASLTDYLSTAGEEPPTPVAGLGIPAAVVGAFFGAAARFHRLAPWTVADDSQVLRVDAPSLGRRNACACIIGALGESFGVLVFDSIADREAIVALQDELDATGQAPEPPDVPLLSINFDHPREVPPSLRAEAKAHRWTLPARSVFPFILLLEPGGRSRAPEARDYVFATACLEALGRFHAECGAMFDEVDPDPVTRRYTIEFLSGGPKVAITAPHPEADWTWGAEDPGPPSPGS